MEPSAADSGVAMASASGPLADVAAYRRFFAEEIEACAGLRTPRLVEAFATVPREKFLGSGPWITRSEADFGGPSRQTPDADPRRVYHNVVLALDPARQLFNGQPSTIGTWIDAFELRPGACVLHVGAGSGYYSAILAHTVAPVGRVVAIEIDEALAGQARHNLEPYDWVDVRHGDATTAPGESFDAILVNAGATHPQDVWLDALKPGGRLVVPLTVSMDPGAPIGKGIVVLVANDGDGSSFATRLLTFVAIYSGQAIRDAQMNALLGKALSRGSWPKLTRLRRDRHEPLPSCWLHADAFCLQSSG
jgi:protein-L-isoaspartate(D-aspartate) O-methyltransferase